MMYELLELFNTLQGEGSTQGLPVTLIRFKNCNIRCPFCDTQNVMSQPTKQFNINDIIRLSNVSRNLLITGGEPTLYINEIIDMLYQLYSRPDAKIPNKVIFETNGWKLDTLVKQIHNTDPLSRISKYVYSWSPKIWSAELYDRAVDRLSLLAYFKNVEIKLVIDPANCEAEKKFIEMALMNGFDKWRIWLMPLGATHDELMHNVYDVIQMAHEIGVNLSPRLHIVFGSNLDKYLNPKEKIIE